MSSETPPRLRGARIEPFDDGKYWRYVIEAEGAVLMSDIYLHATGAARALAHELRLYEPGFVRGQVPQ